MLKGKTIIELTDTKTGEVEKFEDNNMITQAINEIILKRRNYTGFSDGKARESSEVVSSFLSMFPLYKGFFGGIMLFSNTIEENRMFLSGDDVIIGSATFGNSYSGKDNLIGSYNETESEINETEKYVKFVYDFATNQGNGTISSVCLGNYHYIKHALYGTNCDSDYVDSSLGNLLNAPYNNKGNMNDSLKMEYEPNYVLFPTGVCFESGTIKDYTVGSRDDNVYCYETPILFDDLKGHLITLEYVSSKGAITYSNVADRIRLHIYAIRVNDLTLFESFDNTYYNRVIPTEVFTKDFEVTPFGNYGVYNLQTRVSKQGWYDKSTGCAYLLGDTTDKTLSYWDNNAVMTLFRFNLNVENYEDITLETVEITNKTGKRAYISTTNKNQNYYRKICINNGYVFVSLVDSSNNNSFTGFAKINIQDSTDVTVFESKNNYDFCDTQGDFVYIKGVKVFNMKTNELKSTRVKSCNTSHCIKPVPFKHNNFYNLYTGVDSSGNLTWYGTICSRNDYLATINNLDTPVTKTSDKTMKITYILREE